MWRYTYLPISFHGWFWSLLWHLNAVQGPTWHWGKKLYWVQAFMSDSAFALELLMPCLHILLVPPQAVLSATSLHSCKSVWVSRGKLHYEDGRMLLPILKSVLFMLFYYVCRSVASAGYLSAWGCGDQDLLSSDSKEQEWVAATVQFVHFILQYLKASACDSRHNLWSKQWL